MAGKSPGRRCISGGGAIIGAAGVLLIVSELPWLQNIPTLPLRIGLILGPLIFVGTALFCLLLTGNFLGYPEGTAGWMILLIEAACALSIGLTLALLFAGGRPANELAKAEKVMNTSPNGENL